MSEMDAIGKTGRAEKDDARTQHRKEGPVGAAADEGNIDTQSDEADCDQEQVLHHAGISISPGLKRPLGSNLARNPAVSFSMAAGCG